MISLVHGLHMSLSALHVIVLYMYVGRLPVRNGIATAHDVSGPTYTPFKC